MSKVVKNIPEIIDLLQYLPMLEFFGGKAYVCVWVRLFCTFSVIILTLFVILHIFSKKDERVQNCTIYALYIFAVKFPTYKYHVRWFVSLLLLYFKNWGDFANVFILFQIMKEIIDLSTILRFMLTYVRLRCQ